MLTPHNLNEILENLNKIDQCQQYSIVKSHESKKTLEDSIQVIRTLISQELNTQMMAIQKQIEVYNATLDNERRNTDRNITNGNSTSVIDDSYDRKESSE